MGLIMLNQFIEASITNFGSEVGTSIFMTSSHEIMKKLKIAK